MGVKGGFERGQQSSETTASANPFVQENTERAMRAAWNNYNTMPETPAFYGGDGVAGLTGGQQSAIDAANQRLGGTGTDRAFNDYIQGQLGADRTGALEGASGEMMDRARQGAGALANMADSGAYSGALQGMAGNTGAYQSGLQQAASGQVNPLTSAMYRDAAQNLSEQFQEGAVPALNATFAQGGRTGSGLQADALGNAAGELADAQSSLAANMFGNASESALNRQVQASQAGLGNALGASQAGLQSALGAGGQLLGQSGLGMQGLGQLASLQQGAAGMAPAANQMGWRNIQNASQMAGQRQALRQREIDFDRERYDHNQGRDLQDWQRRQGALQMMPGMMSPLQGTGTTTSEGFSSGGRIGKGKQ